MFRLRSKQRHRSVWHVRLVNGRYILWRCPTCSDVCSSELDGRATIPGREAPQLLALRSRIELSHAADMVPHDDDFAGRQYDALCECRESTERGHGSIIGL